MAERLNPYPEGVPDELTIVVTEATTRTSRLLLQHSNDVAYRNNDVGLGNPRAMHLYL